MNFDSICSKYYFSSEGLWYVPIASNLPEREGRIKSRRTVWAQGINPGHTEYLTHVWEAAFTHRINAHYRRRIGRL